MSTGKNIGDFPSGAVRGGCALPELPLQLGEGLPPLPDSLPVFKRNRRTSKPFNHKDFSFSNLAKNFVVKRFRILSFQLLPTFSVAHIRYIPMNGLKHQVLDF